MMTVVLVASASAATARADVEAMNRTASLTYDAATRDAQSVAPDLVAARARANVASAGVGVARMWANPVAIVGTTSDAARFFSTVTVPLPIMRRASTIRAAESSADASAAELPLVRLDARLAAATAWCDLWLAERTMESAREGEARADRVRQSAARRFREGTAPQLDALRADAEYARSRAETLARADLVTASSAALAYWLGRDPAIVLQVEGSPPVRGDLPPLTTLLAKLETHPVLSRASARARAAASLVDVQRSQAWPMLGVQLGAALLDRQAPENNLSAALVLDVPIFNWNRPAITRAENDATRVAGESAAELARLRSMLVSAYASSAAASARADAAVKEVLPAAQTAADATRDAYQIGAVDLSAVLVAEKTLADARQAAVEAVAERGRALARLDHATGGAT